MIVFSIKIWERSIVCLTGSTSDLQNQGVHKISHNLIIVVKYLKKQNLKCFLFILCPNISTVFDFQI